MSFTKRFSPMKVWVFGAVVGVSSAAHAFNVLQCSGDFDVRLNGPSMKTPKSVKRFTIKRDDALELDLSVGGTELGHLFPWDHVVWEADVAATKNFKDIKFKTDDAKLIFVSAVDLKTKKTHSLECEFVFD